MQLNSSRIAPACVAKSVYRRRSISNDE